MEKDGALAEFVRFVEGTEDVLSTRICDKPGEHSSTRGSALGRLTEAGFGETDEESDGVEALVGRHLVREEGAETPNEFQRRDPPSGRNPSKEEVARDCGKVVSPTFDEARSTRLESLTHFVRQRNRQSST